MVVVVFVTVSVFEVVCVSVGGGWGAVHVFFIFKKLVEASSSKSFLFFQPTVVPKVSQWFLR